MLPVRCLPIFLLPLLTSAASLNFATYVGGSGDDLGTAVALDSTGNIVVAGYTNSSDFPATAGAYQTSAPGSGYSGFVEKLDSTGTHLLFATYLPATSDVTVTGMALDAQGNIVVVGHTAKPGSFPITAGAYSSPNANGFIAKLSAAGDKLLFAAGIAAYPSAVALDSKGAIYVSGAAYGNLQTTSGVAQPASGGGTCSDTPTGTGACADAFVAKLSADGSQLVYATYLGGNEEDAGLAIAVDSAGDSYLTGYTASANFPLSHAAQTTFGGRIQVFGGSTAYGDAFVAKLDPAGATLLFSTYLGGSAPDIGYGIALDAGGNAYVAGGTSSPSFPTTGGAFQTVYAGPAPDPDSPSVTGDAFVTAFSPQGSILWSTFLGGSSYDVAAAIALDLSGNVYIAGNTESPDFPLSANSVPSCRKTSGPFVARLDPKGATLLGSSLMSGMGYDQSAALAVDSTGLAYVVGYATSQVFFATPSALQAAYAGGDYDAFLAKVDLSSSTAGPYAACVLNGASFQPGNPAFFPLGAVAPGEIVSVFGTGFGAGSTISFDGLPAPVTYAGAGQINAVVPFGITAKGPTRMTVQKGGTSYGPVLMPVDVSVPGIFTYDSSGIGEAAVLNQDGSLNTTGNPAARGSVITFYATGAGLMNPPEADGSVASMTLLPSQQPVPQLSVSVTIRGAPAQVLYAGAAPGYIAGLLQVNVVVPTTIAAGNSAPLFLTVGSNPSQTQVSLAVK